MTSTIHLVDLAGSERVDKSEVGVGYCASHWAPEEKVHLAIPSAQTTANHLPINCSQVTGQNLKEAQSINKSLSALGDVISALQRRSTHIPFRNSKLTQVIRQMAGG